MVESNTGNLSIVGSFKKSIPDPDFKVSWSTFYFQFYMIQDIKHSCCILKLLIILNK